MRVWAMYNKKYLVNRVLMALRMTEKVYVSESSKQQQTCEVNPSGSGENICVSQKRLHLYFE